MVMNVIEGNTLTFTTTIKSGLSSLSGYTAYFTVKKKLNDDDNIFEKTGSINGLVMTFTVTASDNDLAIGSYIYEITITNGTESYTLEQGTYNVRESLKY